MESRCGESFWRRWIRWICERGMRGTSHNPSQLASKLLIPELHTHRKCHACHAHRLCLPCISIPMSRRVLGKFPSQRPVAQRKSREVLHVLLSFMGSIRQTSYYFGFDIRFRRHGLSSLSSSRCLASVAFALQPISRSLAVIIETRLHLHDVSFPCS
jgi:hypothetical protein